MSIPSARTYDLRVAWYYILTFIIIFLFIFIPKNSLGGQSQSLTGRTLNVGVYVSPPFVFDKQGHFSGMAIELWETIAARRSLQSNYRRYDTFGKLVDATASGEIDVAVTNLTITQNRAERINFTQPWFDAGLRIMVSTQQEANIESVFVGLADSGHLRAYGWLAFVIVAATLVATLFDRRFNPDFPSRWRDGIAESLYSVVSIATSGRPASRTNLFGWIGPGVTHEIFE